MRQIVANAGLRRHDPRHAHQPEEQGDLHRYVDDDGGRYVATDVGAWLGASAGRSTTATIALRITLPSI